MGNLVADERVRAHAASIVARADAEREARREEAALDRLIDGLVEDGLLAEDERSVDELVRQMVEDGFVIETSQ